MRAALLALIFAAAAPAAPAAQEASVRAAIETALAVPGARTEVLDTNGALPARCALVRAEAPRTASASGLVAVHLLGDGCERWVWARVRVSAPTLVTTNEVMEGAPLDGAVTTAEREVLPGRRPLTQLPQGAVAERTLPSGAIVEESLVRVGPRRGEPVTVLLRTGALVVEQRGQAVACRRGHACALLPSGRRVEGDWHDGRIELEIP